MNPRIPVTAHTTIALAIKLGHLYNPVLTDAETQCLTETSTYTGVIPDDLEGLRALMRDAAHACVIELLAHGLSHRDIARSLVVYFTTPGHELALA
jgi:hypothetical protein